MIKYKCTYTSLLGAACPIMFSGLYKCPSPSYCNEYDTAIWNINPKKVCKYCVPLSQDEVPKKKIWCDDMRHCDSYGDSGEKACEGCPGGQVAFVFNRYKRSESNQVRDMLKDLIKYIEKNSFEEEFPRHTSDMRPPIKAVIFSDDVIDKINEIRNHGGKK